MELSSLVLPGCTALMRAHPVGCLQFAQMGERREREWRKGKMECTYVGVRRGKKVSVCVCVCVCYTHT